jgi:hypothetical protein
MRRFAVSFPALCAQHAWLLRFEQPDPPRRSLPPADVTIQSKSTLRYARADVPLGGQVCLAKGAHEELLPYDVQLSTDRAAAEHHLLVKALRSGEPCPVQSGGDRGPGREIRTVAGRLVADEGNRPAFIPPFESDLTCAQHTLTAGAHHMLASPRRKAKAPAQIDHKRERLGKFGDSPAFDPSREISQRADALADILRTDQPRHVSWPDVLIRPQHARYPRPSRISTPTNIRRSPARLHRDCL